MEAVREIIEGKTLGKVINLPEEWRDSKVEIIVLPFKEKAKRKRHKRESIIDELLNNPIKLSSFTPLTRDEIYER